MSENVLKEAGEYTGMVYNITPALNSLQWENMVKQNVKYQNNNLNKYLFYK